MKTEVKEEDDADVADVKAEIAKVEAEIEGLAELATGADTPPMFAEEEEEEEEAADDADDKVSYYANIHKFIYPYILTHVSL